MYRLEAFWACALVPSVCALLVRDDLLRNATTAISPANTQISDPLGVSWGTVASAPTQNANFKVHRESSVNSFEENQSATIAGPPSQDIGSIIQSFLTTAMRPGAPTSISNAQVGITPPHLEPTQGAVVEVTTPARQVSIDVRPANTGISAVSPPQITPPPTITRDGFTIRPVPVISTNTLSKDGQIVATTQVVDYQYVADLSTLSIGVPITISGVRVALTTDASRSTVLIVGDATTTLPRPVQGLPATQMADASAPISISTTVIEGTTKYVIAGQTLAPGQPITVDNVPIAITTSDGSTILVLGGVTTTFVGAPATPISSGGSTAIVTSNGNAKSTPTTKTSGASQSRVLGAYFAAFTVIIASLHHIIWNS